MARTYITITTAAGDRHRIADLHPPVLAALGERDPDAASQAVGRHFADAADILEHLWADPGATWHPDPAAKGDHERIAATG
jgi:DNA-binding GntR family transcriptional regulator